MNARDWALRELDARQLPGWEPNCLRAGRKEPPPADERDRGLAEQIIIGVIKNFFLLEYQLSHFSGREPGKIDPLVRKILAIGLYQLAFLERIPAPAAVNEAVDQTKRFGHKSAAGFVNAVLRNATRQAPPAMPDPATDSTEYARVALSHPPELFRKLRDLLGVEMALEFCRHDNTEPPTIVRLMPGADAHALGDTRTSSNESPIPSPCTQGEGEGGGSLGKSAGNPHPNPPSTYMGRGKEGEIQITPHEQAEMFVVTGGRRADFAKWAKAGLAQVQDPTSAGVVDHLDLKPGLRVLDRCAGLGTKTLQILERIGPQGRVVAVDPSLRRCDELQRIIKRRGLSNVEIFQVSWMADVPPGEFDRILIDAPCSNSGVLPRRPEARYFQDEDSLKSLVELQGKILNDTAGRLAAGGLMVFSTCSVWPQENQELIARFLLDHPRFKLLSELSILPSLNNPTPAQYHDGGYVAMLSQPTEGN